MDHETERIIVKLAKIEEKVDGINERLDRGNGRLAKHDNCIDDLQTIAQKNKTYISIMWGILSALGLAVLGLATALISEKIIKL